MLPSLISRLAPTLSSWAAVHGELPPLAARLRELPWLGVAAVGLAGVGALLAGARFRRPLAVAGGAAVGWLAAASVPSWVANNVGVSRQTLSVVALALLAVGGGLFPALFIFAAGALPGGFVGASFPIDGSAELGAAAGAAVAGVVALFFARWVAAIAGAALGAAMLSAALLAAGDSWPALRVLSDHPSTAAALLAVLTIAGAAFQIRTAWLPPAPGAKHDQGLASPDRAPTVADS